jgi:hypothetical protein
MSNNLFSDRFQKRVTTFVLIFFTWFAIGPWQYAIADSSPPPNQTASGEQKNPLTNLEIVLNKIQKQIQNQKDISSSLSDLINHRLSLQAESVRIFEQFQSLESTLISQSSPPEIIQRHQDAIAKYKQENDRLNQYLDNIQTLAQNNQTDALTSEIAATLTFLEKINPDEPPLGQALRKLPYGQPKSLGESPELMLPVPKPALASDLPTQSDLAETKDIIFSQGIYDLATSLNHNPVRIFNWVRKNILYVPSFGSIQGSEGCRLSKECNAFDTASLLIALLRVSGIPARYADGIVELNDRSFKSIMGDFGDIQAAVNMASRGGVPVALNADKTKVRMRHVWVEAFLQPGNSPQTAWLPLESTLKITKFQAPLAVEKVLGLDFQEIIDSIVQSSIFNPDGSVTGLDETLVSQQIGDVKVKINNLLNQDKYENITFGELLGSLTNKKGLDVSIFSENPWKLWDDVGNIIAVNSRVSELANNFRHRINLQITDISGAIKSLEINRTTAELATHRLTIGYVPATATDIGIIQAFGGLYKTPPYLVHLKPVVYLDGNAIASGPAIPMGVFQRVQVGFTEPSGFNDLVEHFIRSGTYAVVGLDFQHVSSDALGQRADLLKETVEQLGTKELRWDDVLGETLQIQSQTYYALTELFNRQLANQLNIRAEKRVAEMLMTFAPAFAFAGSVPVQVTNVGMNMDHRRNIIAFSSRLNKQADELAYFLSVPGFGSAFEHEIFELYAKSQSVSTIKLFTEANKHNIPIFSIDKTNIDTILPQLQLPQLTLQDIRSYVNVGSWVFVPKQIQNYFNWQGVGYVVVNPTNGAAGYFISGGLAGGASAESSEIINLIKDLTIDLTFDGLEAGLTAAGALKAAEWLPYVGAAVSSGQTILDVMYKTDDILKSVAAGFAVAAIDLTASLIWTGLSEAQLAAGILATPETGGVSLLLVPIESLLTWVVLHLSATVLKQVVIDAIVGQPVALLKQRRKRGEILLMTA